jgi:hypothetical protein
MSLAVVTICYLEIYNLINFYSSRTHIDADCTELQRKRDNKKLYTILVRFMSVN